MKNKGGGDEVKPLKEPKQWNSWQWTFLSIAHAYDFKDVTDPTFTPTQLMLIHAPFLNAENTHIWPTCCQCERIECPTPVI